MQTTKQLMLLIYITQNIILIVGLIVYLLTRYTQSKFESSKAQLVQLYSFVHTHPTSMLNVIYCRALLPNAVSLEFLYFCFLLPARFDVSVNIYTAAPLARLRWQGYDAPCLHQCNGVPYIVQRARMGQSKRCTKIGLQ